MLYDNEWWEIRAARFRAVLSQERAVDKLETKLEFKFGQEVGILLNQEFY